ncbi:MAG: hypothetical protein ABEH38_01650 [Flavobacteriales bacterium]
MSSERLKKVDKVQWGLVGGVIGSILSFLLLYWITQLRGHSTSLSDFFFTKFIYTRDLTWRILSFCLVLNVLLFFLALRWDLEKFAKGVLLIFFIFLPFIIYFRFF